MSRKTYTRRNTRTRLIDLLKEAIELVEKGCPPGHMTKTLKTAMSPMPSSMPSSIAPVPVMPYTPISKAPLSAILEDNSQKTQIIKKKGTVRPGVLKYNEFVKKWISEHPEYQAKGKYQAALKEIQRTGNWKVSTRKITSNMNAKSKLGNAANVNTVNAVNANLANSANVNSANAANAANVNANVNAANVNAANVNVNSANANVNLANAANVNAANTNLADASAKNEGMDDTVGMRKMSINGRNLYVSSDDGVFERDGNSPGDFIGRLVNGEIVEEDAPELPEYS